MLIHAGSRQITLPTPTEATLCELAGVKHLASASRPIALAMMRAAYEAGARDVLRQMDGSRAAQLERELMEGAPEELR